MTLDDLMEAAHAAQLALKSQGIKPEALSVHTEPIGVIVDKETKRVIAISDHAYEVSIALRLLLSIDELTEKDD